jgi:hypothetical protein
MCAIDENLETFKLRSHEKLQEAIQRLTYKNPEN